MKVEIMPVPTRKSKSAGGFSLIEIMVGVAIGLLGVLIIMQVSSIFEGQRRTTTSGSDAQTTGGIAFYMLTRDLRRAGFGLSEPGVIGCTVRRSLNNNPTPSAIMAPVTIVKGVGGLPDQIHLLASSKGNWSLPINLAKDHAQNSTDAYVTTALGMEVNDLLIAYEPRDPSKGCTMFQISGPLNADNKLAVGTDLKVQHVHVSAQIGKWNPDDPTTTFPVGGYTSNALIFNFGGMIDHTYSVDANGDLLLADAAAGTQAVASDIVTIKAQYGFDKTAGTWPPTGSPAVTQWSDTMLDADGDGTVGSGGDMQRIVAIRVALVARSALIEKPNAATGNCDITIGTATATRPVNAPTWVGGAIDVSKNPDGSANPKWQCYRYKTFEDTIAFRNLMWRNK
jgi:type IV pilus assembly protein PilW